MRFLPSLQLIDDPEYWSVHPLGLKFILKVIKYYCKTKDYLGMLLTSIFCVACLKFINIPINISAELDINRIPLKELMFVLLKEFSESLHRWNIIINSSTIMKLAGYLGYPLFILSSGPSLGFDKVHNYTAHSRTFCIPCNKKSLICAICLNLVTSLGIFCKACGHGGHLLHQQQWFYKETTCPAGCGCSCLNKFTTSSEYQIYGKQSTR